MCNALACTPLGNLKFPKLTSICCRWCCPLITPWSQEYQKLSDIAYRQKTLPFQPAHRCPAAREYPVLHATFVPIVPYAKVSSEIGGNSGVSYVIAMTFRMTR